MQRRAKSDFFGGIAVVNARPTHSIGCVPDSLTTLQRACSELARFLNLGSKHLPIHSFAGEQRRKAASNRP
jgi:hypothetical protein